MLKLLPLQDSQGQEKRTRIKSVSQTGFDLATALNTDSRHIFIVHYDVITPSVGRLYEDMIMQRSWYVEDFEVILVGSQGTRSDPSLFPWRLVNIHPFSSFTLSVSPSLLNLHKCLKLNLLCRVLRVWMTLSACKKERTHTHTYKKLKCVRTCFSFKHQLKMSSRDELKCLFYSLSQSSSPLSLCFFFFWASFTALLRERPPCQLKYANCKHNRSADIADDALFLQLWFE